MLKYSKGGVMKKLNLLSHILLLISVIGIIVTYTWEHSLLFSIFAICGVLGGVLDIFCYIWKKTGETQ